MKGIVILILAINVAMAAPSYAQIMRTPCGAFAALTSFSPCMTFLMNIGPTDTLPSSQCCTALRTLASGGMDCLCLFMTGVIPFSIPINRTLATYLPQACDIPSVLLQCKPSGSSLSAQGPVPRELFPYAPPKSTPSSISKASSVVPSPIAPSQAPQSETTPLLTPSSSPSVHSDTPSVMASRVRSQVTPSSASYSLSPSFLLIALGLALLKYY